MRVTQIIKDAIASGVKAKRDAAEAPLNIQLREETCRLKAINDELKDYISKAITIVFTEYAKDHPDFKLEVLNGNSIEPKEVSFSYAAEELANNVNLNSDGFGLRICNKTKQDLFKKREALYIKSQEIVNQIILELELGSAKSKVKDLVDKVQF